MISCGYLLTNARISLIPGAIIAAAGHLMKAGYDASLNNKFVFGLDRYIYNIIEAWDYFMQETPLAITDRSWEFAPDQSSPGMLDLSIDIDFTLAQRFIPVRDPLTLDLDGDGLETVGTAAGILFDYNGDGIKTGTGWVLPDDGFLALDRDGNGLIDSGRELFGDSTPLFDADGNEIGKAADGFAALAQEDTNGDGVVDVDDTNWANLRV